MVPLSIARATPRTRAFGNARSGAKSISHFQSAKVSYWRGNKHFASTLWFYGILDTTHLSLVTLFCHGGFSFLGYPCRRQDSSLPALPLGSGPFRGSVAITRADGLTLKAAVTFPNEKSVVIMAHSGSLKGRWMWKIKAVKMCNRLFCFWSCFSIFISKCQFQNFQSTYSNLLYLSRFEDIKLDFNLRKALKSKTMPSLPSLRSRKWVLVAHRRDPHQSRCQEFRLCRRGEGTAADFPWALNGKIGWTRSV